MPIGFGKNWWYVSSGVLKDDGNQSKCLERHFLGVQKIHIPSELIYRSTKSCFQEVADSLKLYFKSFHKLLFVIEQAYARHSCSKKLNY